MINICGIVIIGFFIFYYELKFGILKVIKIWMLIFFKRIKGLFVFDCDKISRYSSIMWVF